MSRTGVLVNVFNVATKGYGFIKPDGEGDNVYFHINSTGNNLVSEMQQGQHVLYEIETGTSGRPQAINIRKTAEGVERMGGGRQTSPALPSFPLATSSFPAAGAVGAGQAAMNSTFPSVFAGGGLASAFPSNTNANSPVFPAVASAFPPLPATQSAFSFATKPASPMAGPPAVGAPDQSAQSSMRAKKIRPVQADEEVSEHYVCALSQADLRKESLTVAGLVQILLKTPTTTVKAMSNVMKNRFGVAADETKARELLVYDYANLVLNKARSLRRAEQGLPEGGMQAGKKDVSSRLGAVPAAAGGVSSRLQQQDGPQDVRIFVRIKGLANEQQVRDHFAGVDQAKPEPEKCGSFEYVADEGNDTHILKFQTAAGATNAGKNARKDKAGKTYGVWVLTKPSDIRKYASRITADEKRRLGSACAGGAGGAGGRATACADDADANEEIGDCSCGNVKATGRVDASDGNFYCNRCWMQFEQDQAPAESAGNHEEVGEDDASYWEDAEQLSGYDEILPEDDAEVVEEEAEEIPAPKPALKPQTAQISHVAQAAAPSAVAPVEPQVPIGSLPLFMGAPAAGGGMASGSAGGVAPAMQPVASMAPAVHALGGMSSAAQFGGGMSSAVQAVVAQPTTTTSLGIEPKVNAASESGQGVQGLAAGSGYDGTMISGGGAPRCLTMCSLKEFETRSNMGRQSADGAHGSSHSISTMERDSNGHAKLELAVCRYEFHRGGAGKVFEPEEIRTLELMHKTIDHCQRHWLTQKMIEHCDGGYVYVYKIMHDVVKAISSDMAYVRRHYPPSLIVAGVFERCLRIAIDAHYRIAEDLSVDNARNLKWANERIESHGIPSAQGLGASRRESIGFTRCAGGSGTAIGAHEDYIYKNCMTLIKDVYPELRARGIWPTHEPEFVSYTIMILSIRHTYQVAIQELYYSLPAQMRKHPEVLRAKELAMCMQMGNYVRFFTILRSADTPYLLCCLAHQHMHTIRQQALQTMVDSLDKKAEKGISVAFAVQYMGFDDAEHCTAYMAKRGVPIQDGTVLLYKIDRLKPIADFEFVECLKVGFISDKMPKSPCEVVGQRPAPTDAGAVDMTAVRQADDERRRAEAEAKRFQARAEEERKEQERNEKRRKAMDTLASARQALGRKDLAGARAMASEARVVLLGISQSVGEVDELLQEVKRVEDKDVREQKEREARMEEEKKQKEREEREARERQEREREAMKAKQDGLSKVSLAIDAMSSGSLDGAEKLLDEAKAFLQAAGDEGDRAWVEARGKLGKLKEEREIQMQKAREEEERRKRAERDRVIGEGNHKVRQGIKVVQAARAVLKSCQDIVADEQQLSCAELGSLMSAHAQALAQLMEANKCIAAARALHDMYKDGAKDDIASVVREVDAAARIASLIASKVTGEEARRTAEKDKLQKARERRHRKRKERPLAPANADATAGWGAGIVPPRAVKRRDTLPPSGIELQAGAYQSRHIRSELIAAARRPLDVGDAMCPILAAYVQVDALIAPCAGEDAISKSFAQNVFNDSTADPSFISLVCVNSTTAHVRKSGVRVTVHRTCEDVSEALAVAKRVQDARVRVQAAIGVPLMELHAHVPVKTCVKLMVTKAPAGGEAHQANDKWLKSKLGIAVEGTPRTLTHVVDHESGARFEASVCLRCGELGDTGEVSWQGASGAIVLLHPFVDESQVSWWREASRVAQQAWSALDAKALQQGGGLAVMIAASEEGLKELQERTEVEDLEGLFAERLGLAQMSAAKVFLLDEVEVLQAEAVAGLNNRTSMPGMSGSSRHASERGSLWRAMQWLARRSRRMPTVSRIRFVDVVRSRTAALLGCVDPQAVMSSDLMRCGVQAFNKVCLAEVQALAHVLHADIAMLSWRIPEFPECEVAVEGFEQALMDLQRALRSTVLPVPQNAGAFDEETPEDIVAYAMSVCRSVLQASPPEVPSGAYDNAAAIAVAEANLRAIVASVATHDLQSAKRACGRMLREALFFRTSQLQSDMLTVAFVGSTVVWNWVHREPDTQRCWSQARPAPTLTSMLRMSPEPDMADPSAHVPTPPLTPPPEEKKRKRNEVVHWVDDDEGVEDSDDVQEEEEPDILDKQCYALVAAARMEGERLSALEQAVGNKRPHLDDDEYDDGLHSRMRTSSCVSRLDQLKEWLSETWKGLVS